MMNMPNLLRFYTRAILILLICWASGISARSQGFVQVKGHQFLLNGKPYYYIGADYWYGGLLAGVNGNAGKKRLGQELDFLRARGIDNLRALAGGEGLGLRQGQLPYNLQPTQGHFDPRLLKSLDYFVAQVAKRHMKIVFYITNNWNWSGGFGQYVQWNESSAQRNLIGRFYSCPSCIQAERYYIKFLILHRNSYTGRLNRDEPAIMAWELANEPRPMEDSNIHRYEQWIGQTAAYIKNLDPHHLVTTGTEGEMGTGNHLSVWEKIHSFPAVDYLSIHIWPKNWGWFRDTALFGSFTRIEDNTYHYIREHLAVADTLDKPLVIEEFGLPRDGELYTLKAPTTLRDAYYAYILKIWEEECRSGGALAGLNFWGFGGNAHLDPRGIMWKKGDDFTGDPGMEPQGLNSVFMTDSSTFRVLTQYQRP